MSWSRLAAVVLGLSTIAGSAGGQLIPRLPTRPGAVQQQPAQRDTLHDTLHVKWPSPDSVTQLLLTKPGYSITRYQGDTAFFNATKRELDILPGGKSKRVVVDRDSQVVVSDSGIYYREATRRVTTGGNYIFSSPGSGQADINGHGLSDYDLRNRSVRVRNVRLPVDNGVTWLMSFGIAQVQLDSAGKSPTVWGGGGTLTSCTDSIPDYHFEFNEAKRYGNSLVGRPAVLYLKDIPVMWLPFFFSDTRNGRHNGILMPQFGVGDIVRNSPTYRRNVEHAGYYWALNDYMDIATWLDWRSSAGATQGDPGWIKYNADWNYKWLDRFLGGRIGLGYTSQRDGSTNTAVSWSHQQDFSHDSHFNSNLNYVTSTTLQRQNTFNPYAALATISSQATYQSKLGPASFSLGATRKQYPGRDQVDQTFPTLSLTSTAIGIGSWLTWTPSFSFNRSDVLHMDQPGIGLFEYSTNAAGGRDSTKNTSRSSANSSITFDTPLQIFGKDFKNSFRITQQRNNFAQQFPIYDVNTGEITDTRVFAATYQTAIDWTPDFSLPPLARNRFNLTPSLSLQNVDPGPFWVASERSNGQFVSQKKRFTAGLSASPTLFGLFPGFGPFQRIRHQISPTIGYTYAPAADVSDEYLRALGRTRKGYLGSLMQNAVTFGLTQNFEAKLKTRGDTSGNTEGQTIRLLTLNMTPLSYDFVRANSPTVHSKLAGFTTENWGYSVNSELLPGFDFSSNYSLFQGSALSDTAKFKPYLTSISASFNISRDQNPLTVLSRLFGRTAAPQSQPTANPTNGVRSPADEAQARALAAQPVAGSGRNDRFLIPSSQGWRASFTFSRSSPRPPVGGTPIEFDPRARCAQNFGEGTLLFDACVAQQRIQPTTDTPVTSQTAGGQAYHIPPTTSLNGNINFDLTTKWTASWQTTYDFERHEFASHLVSLQRDIHDWRALFGFSQSPNGNFAFNFSVALKAEPDLKFDYNRQTVRSGTTPF